MGMSNINNWQTATLLGQYDYGNSRGRGYEDGKLNRSEFKDMLTDIFGSGGINEARRNFNKADLNGDGQVDRRELKSFLDKIREGDTKLGNNNRGDLEDLLKKLIRMMGGDPSQCRNLSELEDLLEDLMGGGQGSGGGGCGSGGGGGCGGAGGGGGGCPPSNYTPPCPPPTPSPSPGADEKDAGGGSGKVVGRGGLAAKMIQAAGINGKLSRAEANKVFNHLDNKAEEAGSASKLTQSERDNIFNRFDVNNDGQWNQSEQKQFRDYAMSGNVWQDNQMSIGDWDRMNDEH